MPARKSRQTTIAPPAPSAAIAGVSCALGMVQTAIPSLTQSARGDGAVAIVATARNMKTILPVLVIARPPVGETDYAGRISGGFYHGGYGARRDNCDPPRWRGGSAGRFAPFDIAG